jgi:hypothetical protein
MQILDIADYPITNELEEHLPIEEVPIEDLPIDTLPVDTIPVDGIPADPSYSSVLFWAIVVVMFFLLVCLFFVWRYWRKHNYRS